MKKKIKTKKESKKKIKQGKLKLPKLPRMPRLPRYKGDWRLGERSFDEVAAYRIH